MSQVCGFNRVLKHHECIFLFISAVSHTCTHRQSHPKSTFTTNPHPHICMLTTTYSPTSQSMLILCLANTEKENLKQCICYALVE